MPLLLLPRIARAGVAVAIPLEALLKESRHVLLATAVEAHSKWQVIGDHRRIITETRVEVEQVLKSERAGSSSLWVRTLGGRVGDVGQVVHGEAAITLGQRALLFLSARPKALHVTAMAQGHYPIRVDARGVQRLAVSPRLAHLVNKRGAAVERLVGRSWNSAEHLIREELSHAR